MIAVGILCLAVALFLCMAGPVAPRRSERELFTWALLGVLSMAFSAGLLLAPGGAP